MEYVAYIIIAAIILIFRAVQASNKNKSVPGRQNKQIQQNTARKTSQQSGGQANVDKQRQIYKELGLESLFDTMQTAQQKQNQQQSKLKDGTDQDLKGWKQEQARKKAVKDREKVDREQAKVAKEKAKQKRYGGHFSEEALAEQYEKKHAQGKELEHHFHHYVDQEEFTGKAYSEADSYENTYAGQDIVSHGNKGGKKLKSFFGGKNAMRKAILFSEIIKRRYN